MSNLNRFKVLVSAAISVYSNPHLKESALNIEEEFGIKLSPPETSFIKETLIPSLTKINNMQNFAQLILEAEEVEYEETPELNSEDKPTNEVDPPVSTSKPKPRVRLKVRRELKKSKPEQVSPITPEQTAKSEDDEMASDLWNSYNDYHNDKGDMNSTDSHTSGNTEKEKNPQEEINSASNDSSIEKAPEPSNDSDLINQEQVSEMENLLSSLFNRTVEPLLSKEGDSKEKVESPKDDSVGEEDSNIKDKLGDLKGWNESRNTFNWMTLIEAVNFDNPEELEEAIRKKFEKDVNNNPKTAEIDSEDVVDQIIPDTFSPIIAKYLLSDRKLKKNPLVQGKTEKELREVITSILSKNQSNIDKIKKSWNILHKIQHKGSTSESSYNKSVIEPLFENHIVPTVKKIFTTSFITKIIKNDPTKELDDYVKVGLNDVMAHLKERNGLFKKALKTNLEKYNVIAKTKVEDEQVYTDLEKYTEHEFFNESSPIYSITKFINDEVVNSSYKTNSKYPENVQKALEGIEDEVGKPRYSNDLSIFDVQDVIHKLIKSKDPVVRPAIEGDGAKAAIDLYRKYRNNRKLSKYDKSLFKALSGGGGKLFASSKYAIAPNGDILMYDDYKDQYDPTLWSKVKRSINKSYRESSELSHGRLIIESIKLDEASSENYDRDYKKEYSYPCQSSKKAIENRGKRNNARRRMMRKGKVKKYDKKDVMHVKALSHGGSNNPDNWKVGTQKQNRSFKRNSDGSMK